MNELQAIRRAYEAPVEAAMAALIPAIPVYTDNRFYDANDANAEFCLCRVSFGLMTENAIGVCGDIEFIRGALVMEVFTPKGAGPGRGQEAAQALWAALMPLNRAMGSTDGLVARIGPLRGPSFTPLSGRPHMMTSLSAPIRARWAGGSSLFPEEPPNVGLITDQQQRLVVVPGVAKRRKRG